MLFDTHVDNVSTKVGVSGYTAGSGSMVLVLNGGLFFPALGTGEFYKITVIQAAFAYVPSAPVTTYTIFKVTSVSGDTLTIDSAIEGTTDRDYDYLDVVEIRVTAGTHDTIDNAIMGLNAAFVTLQGAL